jgi:uncharacterized membrane protein YgaE (UPF0421/DUF939 family)
MGLRSAALTGRRRAEQGWNRARASAGPIAEAAIAAGLAWAFATRVLHHEAPFFAPVAAWVCLGFARDRDLRLVAELAFGVSVGVGLGDVLVHLIGSGPVQVGAVLMVAALTGRFLDRGRLVTMQAGVQSIIIVAVPAGLGFSPVGRWMDALTGGVAALACAVIVPHDPTKTLRGVASRGWGEIAGIVETVARALAAEDPKIAQDALVRGRASQDVFTDWFAGGRRAQQLAKVSPQRRRHIKAVNELARPAVYADRAVRNARVIARRAESILEMTASDPRAESRLQALAEATAALAGAFRAVAEATKRGEALPNLRPAVLEAGDRLTAELAGESWQPRAYVLLLRSMTIDVLQACGMRRQSARRALPPIAGLRDAD